MANEEDRRYAILHWLMHRSVNAELLELDGEYSRVLSEQQRAECSAAIDHILNRMSCQDSAHTEFHAHPWLSPDVGCRRPWLEALRNILKDWEGFLEWDPRSNWGPLHKVDFAELSDLDYCTVELVILSFWIQFCLEHLGFYPAALLPTPDVPPFICSSHR
jgi:hypothetical protein